MFSWVPPRDSNSDMLIQSQLSCNLPLPLIFPDYAIFVCILKGIGEPHMHRIGAGQSGKTRENYGNIIQMLPVLLPVEEAGGAHTIKPNRSPSLWPPPCRTDAASSPLAHPAASSCVPYALLVQSLFVIANVGRALQLVALPQLQLFGRIPSPTIGTSARESDRLYPLRAPA